MNPPNSLETQLNGWTPRRPSAALKRRLFGRRPQPSEQGHPVRAWAWLAPVTAVFLGLMTLQAPDKSPLFAIPLVSSPPLGLEGGIPDQRASAYLADAMHSPRNLCQLATFEWTNPVHSLTTTAPFLGTNILFQ